MSALFILGIFAFPLFLYWVRFRMSISKIDLLLKLLIVWTYFILIFYTGRWEFLSYFLRYIFFFLLIVVTIKSLMQFKNLELFDINRRWGWTKFALGFPVFLLLVWGVVEVNSGFSTEEKGINIAFPLREGFIGQGGNSVLINYHHSDTTSQQYALDIVKLNIFGMRSRFLFPNDLKDYFIYGDTLFSPCNGLIIKAKDGQDNVAIGFVDNLNPAGNHIVLEYQNNLILMAHILKNSILVSEGDIVKKGQPIARVGNSGRTTQPHLHIHAIEGTDTSKIIYDGNGVPIYFDNKFPIRNDIVKKE